MENVRERLLAMVQLERDAGHLQAAMQHVESIAAGLQGPEAPDEVSGAVSPPMSVLQHCLCTASGATQSDGQYGR